MQSCNSYNYYEIQGQIKHIDRAVQHLPTRWKSIYRKEPFFLMPILFSEKRPLWPDETKISLYGIYKSDLKTLSAVIHILYKPKFLNTEFKIWFENGSYSCIVQVSEYLLVKSNDESNKKYTVMGSEPSKTRLKTLSASKMTRRFETIWKYS